MILAICGALAACSDTIPEPLAPSIATSPVGPALSVARVETDSPISAAERAAAEQLARSLALALNTADARQEVKTALVTSAVRERKLHFATYLQGRGGRLVAAMARNGGLSAGGLQAAVAAVRDLEFYMPVGAHRLAWTGDTPIAVGVQLDESEAPIMYTPRGERLVGRLDMPPADPVLMIVPSETNFASQDDLNLHGRAARICVIGTTDAVEAAARRCDA
ncbi:MAG TPA: hypothetical protein VHM30_20155, partial [Gemmatimonadaceae bacterium]|nr:hypothetical protein [Gemmatimonadaceae bacterium]